jgi:hypothetical protein
MARGEFGCFAALFAAKCVNAAHKLVVSAFE